MKRNLLSLVLPAVSLALATLPAGAAQDPPAPPVREVCPADDAAAGPALRAFIDPETGQLRAPSPEEARALADAARADLARAVESLEAVVHPDGMISLDLKGFFMQNVVAVRTPDGSLSMGCVDGPPTPVTFVPPDAVKPAPKLEER